MSCRTSLPSAPRTGSTNRRAAMSCTLLTVIRTDVAGAPLELRPGIPEEYSGSRPVFYINLEKKSGAKARFLWDARRGHAGPLFQLGKQPSQGILL